MIGLVNVVSSSIARECGSGLVPHAGPEISVAAIARKHAGAEHMVFVGQVRGWPVAGEGARKLAPITHSVALQLFAYDLAKALGREIDRPRNPAKSVTVE